MSTKYSVEGSILETDSKQEYDAKEHVVELFNDFAKTYRPTPRIKYELFRDENNPWGTVELVTIKYTKHSGREPMYLNVSGADRATIIMYITEAIQGSKPYPLITDPETIAKIDEDLDNRKVDRRRKG